MCTVGERVGWWFCRQPGNVGSINWFILIPELLIGLFFPYFVLMAKLFTKQENRVGFWGVWRNVDVMICGMDIGQQSTLDTLENRLGAIFESERGLAKFLSFFSLEWSWRLHGSMILFLRSASWKGGGKVVKIIPPAKVTRQHRKLKVSSQKLQIAGFTFSSITRIKMTSNVGNYRES